MAASTAVNFAVVHTGVALGLGTSIELVMPKYNESNSVMETAVETAIQASLNGFALVLSSRYLSDNDPTAGIMFGWVLSSAQPEFNKRITRLSTVLKQQVDGLRTGKSA